MVTQWMVFDPPCRISGSYNCMCCPKPSTSPLMRAARLDPSGSASGSTERAHARDAPWRKLWRRYPGELSDAGTRGKYCMSLAQTPSALRTTEQAIAATQTTGGLRAAERRIGWYRQSWSHRLPRHWTLTDPAVVRSRALSTADTCGKENITVATRSQ